MIINNDQGLPVFVLPVAPLLERLLFTWGVTHVEANFFRAISEKLYDNKISIPFKSSIQGLMYHSVKKFPFNLRM